MEWPEIIKCDACEGECSGESPSCLLAASANVMGALPSLLVAGVGGIVCTAAKFVADELAGSN